MESVREKARAQLEQALAAVRNAYIKTASGEPEQAVSYLRAAYVELAGAEAELTGEEQRKF